jgi:hypothetical protein
MIYILKPCPPKIQEPVENSPVQSPAVEDVVIDKDIYVKSQPFKCINGAPGEQFSGIYYFKNTGPSDARLTAVFDYTHDNPDVATQLVIKSMTFDGASVALPRDMSYGKTTLADIKKVAITLTNNLSGV